MTLEERVVDFNEWLHGISGYRLGPLERKHLVTDFKAVRRAALKEGRVDATAEDEKDESIDRWRTRCEAHMAQRDAALTRVVELEQEIADWKGGT